MLTKGDRVMVNDGPDYRNEEGVISDVDFSDTFPYVVEFPDGTWDVFNPDKLTLVKEDNHAGR